MTKNAGNCQSPIYTSSYYTITEKEPWEQIAFVSTLARQADERTARPAPASTPASSTARSSSGSPTTSQAISIPQSWPMAGWSMRPGIARRLTTACRSATCGNRQHRRLGSGPDGSVAGRGSAHALCDGARTVVFVETDRMARDGAGGLSGVSLAGRSIHIARSPRPRMAASHFSCPLPRQDSGLMVPRRRLGLTGPLSPGSCDRRRRAGAGRPAVPRESRPGGPPRRGPTAGPAWSQPTTPWPSFDCMNVYSTEFADRSWLPKAR